MSRSYSEKTLKILFALSGDQCAHPDCTEAIIQPGTEQSDALVVGQIAHIYAVKDNGPRGNPDLTQEQRNAHENLILLCTLCRARHSVHYADSRIMPRGLMGVGFCGFVARLACLTYQSILEHSESH